MMDLVVIDGVNYDVLVTAIEEGTAIVEGSNTGVALYHNREIRDILGIKYTHTITFAPDSDIEAFESLYNHLFGTIRNSVMLKVVHGQDHIEYEAAYNTSSRRVEYINDVNDVVGWSELTIQFRSIETIIQPE